MNGPPVTNGVEIPGERYTNVYEHSVNCDRVVCSLSTPKLQKVMPPPLFKLVLYRSIIRREVVSSYKKGMELFMCYDSGRRGIKFGVIDDCFYVV